MNTTSKNENPVVIDGMGEIHPFYPKSLISEILESGTNAVMITLRGNPALNGPEAYHDALTSVSVFEHYIGVNHDCLLKATRAQDIERARDEKRLALLYMFQNTAPIGTDLDKLGFFYNLGVRCMQLTYNTRNLVGDGYMEKSNAGLSLFGHTVIEKMNELGMLIGLSLAGGATMSEAIKFSKRPVVISHSACKAVHNHHRNVSDENIKALGDRGGVIGIYQINPHVSPRGYATTLDDYLKHIDHAVRIGGIDHVGIGSNREHRAIPDSAEEKRKLEDEMAGLHPDRSRKIDWPFFINELNHPRRMETVRNGLAKRGYKAREIDKIMGLNFYRLYREVIG